MQQHNNFRQPSAYLSLLLRPALESHIFFALPVVSSSRGRTADAVLCSVPLLVVRDDGPCLVQAGVHPLQDHAAFTQGFPHAQGMVLV